MKGVSDLNLCANICQLPANATCHFYLLLNGTCYLGNVLATQSVIAKRSDAQNIYVIASEQLRNGYLRCICLTRTAHKSFKR